MAGAVHVGEREQRGRQRRVLPDRQLDQSALRLRHAHGLALTAVHAVHPPLAAVAAGGVQALTAEVARAVGPHEGGDDQVTAAQTGHLRADLLDHAEELVPHTASLGGGGHLRVRPQVAAADAGGRDAYDGVGGGLDLRVGDVLDADVSGAVHDCGSHERSSLWGVGPRVVEVQGGRGARHVAGRTVRGSGVRGSGVRGCDRAPHRCPAQVRTPAHWGA